MTDEENKDVTEQILFIGMLPERYYGTESKLSNESPASLKRLEACLPHNSRLDFLPTMGQNLGFTGVNTPLADIWGFTSGEVEYVVVNTVGGDEVMGVMDVIKKQASAVRPDMRADKACVVLHSPPLNDSSIEKWFTEKGFKHFVFYTTELTEHLEQYLKEKYTDYGKRKNKTTNENQKLEGIESIVDFQEEYKEIFEKYKKCQSKQRKSSETCTGIYESRAHWDNFNRLEAEKERLANLAERLQNNFGIRPFLSENFLQEIYKILIEEERWIFRLWGCEEMLAEEEKMPSEELIQEEYKRFLKKGEVKQVLNLQKLSGIKPVLSEGFVQEIYREITDQVGFGERTVSVLCAGGFNIPEQKVAPGWLEKSKRLYELSGIKPSKENADKAYKEVIHRCYVDEIISFYDFFGIKPSEEVVQKGYQRFMKNLTIDNAISLKKLSGIRPILPEDIVQDVYQRLIECGQIGDAKKFQEFSGIKPSEETYRTLLDTILEK